MERYGRNMGRKRSRGGQSLVEFALVLPILVILLLGLLDLGRMYFAYVAITDAAGEGVAYGARNPTDENGIRQRASEATEGLVEIGTDQVTVSPVTESSDAITVTVTYSSTLITPLIRSMVPGGVLPLRAVAVQGI
jgi:Flp pilus assembly protein TadG